MTTQRDSHLQTIRDIRAQALAAMEGMDYCLDWKPGPEDWSAREVIYHLVDTPVGGIHTLILGILSGGVTECEITPDSPNMTPDRLKVEIEEARSDLTAVLDGLEEGIRDADDEALATATVRAYLTARGETQERNPEMLLQGLFARHWREHLGQLEELRQSLGM